MQAADVIQQYFDAFRVKDEAKIRSLLSRTVVLRDPFVGEVDGRENVMQVYQEMFAGNEFELELKRQYKRHDQSYAVEFALSITDSGGERSTLEGIDCIELSEERITAIRAYLDVGSNSAR